MYSYGISVKLSISNKAGHRVKRKKFIMNEQSNGEPTSPLAPAPGSLPPETPIAPAVEAGPLQPPSRPKLSKKIILVLASLLVLAMGAGAYFMVSNKSTTKDTKVYHVGVLNALDFFGTTTDGFKQKMTELGYVEGENIVYDVQKAAAPSGNQAIIKKFVDDKVDLILAFPTEASIEAKEGTEGTSIPVISGNAIIEGIGLVDSIQHPGGNLTGVRFPGPEIALKRFELLHQIAPAAKRIWVPYLKDYPSVAPALEVLDPAAEAAGVTLVKTPFVTPDELTAYLKARPSSGDQGYDAVLFVPEPLSTIADAANAIYAFADIQKLPVGGGFLLEGDTGSILNILPNSLEVGKLAAPLADKIFKGTSAGDIPIVTPETELSINFKAILKLKLTVDDGLLSTAMKVVR